MTADPKIVVVTEVSCSICGTPRVNIHHQSFPEMSISAESPQRAVEELAIRLQANLDAVSDPSHQEPVRRAIADVQAYLTREAVPGPELCEVIDVAPAESDKPDAPSSMLAKTETLEIRLLTLCKGREIPTHYARGEITVHCVEGRIAFTSGAATRELAAGQLIVLAAGEPHSLVGLENSSVLVTKVLLTQPPARDMPEKSSGRETVADVPQANAEGSGK